jgi:putative membrane protein
MMLLPVLAANAQEAVANWHARTLGEAVWQVALFALLGVALAIVGYKLFDLATPGKLHHEILQNKNVAAAIIGAAVILGVCVLVAAAMLG